MKGSPKPIIGDPNISEFILLASHGLRSPLTAIRWGLEVLASDKIGKHNQAQEDLTVELHRNAREMSSILKSMITLSRITQGVHHVESERVDVAAFLREVDELHREWAEVRKISVDSSFPETLEVESDHSLLHSIILHLHSLAIESSDSGSSLTVTTKKDGEHVSIEFSGKFVVPNLNFLKPVSDDVEDQAIIGGTPGLLLFLSEKLSESIGWKLEMDAVKDGSTKRYMLRS